ncbi:MAG: diguanylate cyclase [Gammaproteobacteria bacterium]|nr:diguanylate cyclase [Gammaproteobacteria bacterium]
MNSHIPPLLPILVFIGLLAQSTLCFADKYFTVRIGVYENPPIVFADNEDILQGLYVDVLEEIGQRENLRIQFVMGSRKEGIKRLYLGEIDAMTGIPRTEDASLHFSDEPLLTIWEQVYVQPDSELMSIFDLQGKSIALVRASAAEKRFRELCEQFKVQPQISVLDSYAQVLESVSEKKTDAGIVSSAFGNAHEREYDVRRSPMIFDPFDLLVMQLEDGSSKFSDTVDIYVANWKRSKDSYLYKRITRWTGEASPEYRAGAQRQNKIPNIAIGISAIIIALFFVLWLHARAQINKLQKETKGLRQDERRYRLLVENIPYGLQEIDTSGTIIYTNMAEHRIRRYNHGELIGKSILDMAATAEERKKLEDFLVTLIKEQPSPASSQGKILRKDGKISEIRSDWSYKRNPQGEVVGFLSLVTDVSESMQAKERILSHHKGIQNTANKRAKDLADAYNDLLMAAAVFESTTEGILVMKPDSSIQTINPAVTAITDYHEEDIINKELSILGFEQRDKSPYRKIWGTLIKHGKWQGEVRNQRHNGKLYPAWLSMSAILNAHGIATQYVALLSDITKRKQQEQQIWHQANYDPLTNLPNRNLFQQRLKQGIAQAARDKEMTALMFIDLDRFKEVNDTLGHDAGDELLKTAAKRLSDCVRKQGTVARMGGDEFTVIMPNIKEVQTAESTAQNIVKSLRNPFHLQQQNVFISGSIGVVLYPDDGETLTMLLKNADIAMYRVKEQGRNSYCFYNTE